ESSYINIENRSSFIVTGSCSIDGTSNVAVEVASINTTVDCISGAWSVSLDLSSLADGPVTVKVIQASNFTDAVSERTRLFNKYTVAPVITFGSPAESSYINLNNATNFVVSGACYSAGANIAVTGADATAYAICNGSNWTATLTFNGNLEESRTVTATMTDFAGNKADVNRTFSLDTIAPLINITAPAEGAIINSLNQNSFSVSGTCSEDGSNSVIIRQDETVIATVDCLTSLWSATLDVSSFTDGYLAISFSHHDIAGNNTTNHRNFIKNTFITSAVLSGLPEVVSNATELNVTVGGLNVSSYFYKYGDNTLDCTNAADYVGPSSISTLITGDLADDGPKKLCVRGLDIYGNIQPLTGATVYSWLKDSSYVDPDPGTTTGETTGETTTGETTGETTTGETTGDTTTRDTT